MHPFRVSINAKGGDCWHVYRKSVLVIDGKNNRKPNLERVEDEKSQKRYWFPEVQTRSKRWTRRRRKGRDPCTLRKPSKSERSETQEEERQRLRIRSSEFLSVIRLI
jgi:hypothetical protein